MRKIIFIILLLLQISCDNSDKFSTTSPNGKLTFEIEQLMTGDFAFSFIAEKNELITKSLLGFETENNIFFPSKKWEIKDYAINSYDGIWKPLWGKREKVIDKYNEITLFLETEEIAKINKLEIIIRAYDDGIAFRYVVPEEIKADTRIEKERTQFNFTDNYTSWFYNGEYHNIGPVKLTDVDSLQQPVMTIKVADNQYLAIHEANLEEGEPLLLSSKKDEVLFETTNSPKIISGGYRSAWRVIFYGETPGIMVDSHLLELLNPDPDPAIDFSWVKPGMAVWDWRINGAKVGDFTYSMSYPSWIKMVDFAAEQGMSYLVLDANWYGPEFEKHSDPLIGEKANDVKRLIEYGKERGIGIWLYLNDIGGREYPIEKTLKQYGDWGAAGVKYGFMKGSITEKLERTRMITRLCAENKLLINYHDGPIHPYGQMRTWPNALTREYCHAQLDAHRVFMPKTFVTTVFVNMLAGPIDMNNGMFDLRKGHTDRIDESQPVPSTLVSEAARTAIIFSGVTILPDIPEFYNKYPPLLRFISAQKMPWLESKTLSGEIGKHIIMMRETNKHYLVAGAIDEEGGKLNFSLDFLPKGEFNAELTIDGENAHYLRNRESLQSKRITINSESELNLKLAPGGGFCILINKNK